MIKTFKNRALAAFHENKRDTRRLPVHGQARISRLALILTALEAATHPRDLDLPGLRWHSLDPMQPNTWTVWVTGNYRVTFGWDDGPIDVDILDYH